MEIDIHCIEYDVQKNESNFEKHGVFLSEAVEFEWDTACCWSDTRFDYGEDRRVCIGYIQDRLYVIVYVQRAKNIRIISLRKANKREERIYAIT